MSAWLVRWATIEELLGLHQSLTIIYVVDGFDATLANEEAYPEYEVSGHGETIEQALDQLEAELVRLGTRKERGAVV